MLLEFSVVIQQLLNLLILIDNKNLQKTLHK